MTLINIDSAMKKMYFKSSLFTTLAYFDFWQTYLVVLEHNIVRPEVPMAASIYGCLHLTHKQVQLFPSSYTEKFSHSEAQKNILTNNKNYDQNFRTMLNTRITKVNFAFKGSVREKRKGV